MKPILYEQTETAFTSQGIGVLADALKCVVTEELNNVFDLEMTYPVTGVLFKSLTLRRIIKAKPNQTDDPQPFRIYKITKPMNGSVTVLAHHISYDLSGMVVPPFTVQTPAAVVASITGTAIPTIQPYTFTVNSTATGEVKEETPKSARAVIGDMVEVHDVELSYDVHHITVDDVRGSDKGAVIAYGKNLMDLKQEENCADICTGVYPYYHSESVDVTISTNRGVINLPGTFDFERIVPLDLSSAFSSETIPTENDLRQKALEYIYKNKLGIPKVNLTINYLSIEDSEENLHIYENIALGDTVTIRFEKLDINTKSRCVQYVYDAVTERVQNITIGDKPETFSDSVVKTMNIGEEFNKAIMGAVARATTLITNGVGGYVRFHKSNPSLTYPDELLILGDSPDINEAQQVWRWNKEGLAYSSHGYDPRPYTYKTAMTADGQIVADMITTGILSAIEIYNHSDSAQATFHVTSTGEVFATKGTIGGFNIDANSLYNNTIQLHNTNGMTVINGGQVVGRIAPIGTNKDIFSFILRSGASMAWSIERDDGTIVPILSYVKSTGQLNVHCTLNMRTNRIVNVRVNKTVAYTIKHSYVNITDNGDGTYKMTIQQEESDFNSSGQFIETRYTAFNTYYIRKAS